MHRVLTRICSVHQRSHRVSSILLLAAGLGACTAPVPLPPVPDLSSPVAGEADTLPPYRLQVGDVLDLKFPLNPELNDQVTVRPDGMISTGFVQDVPAYGRTVKELTDDLKDQYKADLTNPRISAILRTFAPNRVYVAGEVNTPGEFITAGPNLTLSQAITRAGGVKFSANKERVFIIRRGPHDVPEAYDADYFGVITGRDPQADVRLAQYDVVYVSRTGIGDAYQVANQYLLQFIPISAGATLTGTGAIP
jgi:polysaccharide biosynthesis/export protein